MNRIKFLFAWYDFWVGVYWDRRKRQLYILPIPFCGVVVDCRSYCAIMTNHCQPPRRMGYCVVDGEPDANLDGLILQRISKAEYLREISK